MKTGQAPVVIFSTQTQDHVPAVASLKLHRFSTRSMNLRATAAGPLGSAQLEQAFSLLSSVAFVV